MLFLILVWFVFISSASAQPVTFTTRFVWGDGRTVVQSSDGLSRIDLISFPGPHTLPVNNTDFSYALIGQIRGTRRTGSRASGQLIVEINTGAGSDLRIPVSLNTEDPNDTGPPVWSLGYEKDGVYFSLAEGPVIPTHATEFVMYAYSQTILSGARKLLKMDAWREKLEQQEQKWKRS